MPLKQWPFSNGSKQTNKRNGKHTKTNGEEEDRKTMLTNDTKTIHRREEAQNRNEAPEKVKYENVSDALKS